MIELRNWNIDRDWSNDVLARSASYSTISFDIFDTLITRGYANPVDVFAEVEKRLVDAGFERAEGFAQQRETAEQRARKKHSAGRGAEDISLDEIYAELPTLNPYFNHWEEAKARELQVEHDTLFAVPDTLELVRQLYERGSNVVFVSDMYLPSSFLAEVLHNCGYSGWKELIVSNEVNATKASGNIWPLLEQRHAGPILHIGDDDWSDVESPRRHGIDSIPFTRARTERRVGGPLNPGIIAFSKATRALTLHHRGTAAVPSVRNTYEDLGRTFGALVVGSFLQWLIKRSELHDIRRLYFCARDGYLLHQVWKRLDLSKTTGLEVSYLEVARRPLNLASGYLDSQPHRLDRRLVEFLCSSNGQATVDTVLKRIDLHKDERLLQKAIKTFGSLQVVITYPDMHAAMADVFNQCSDIVYHKLYGHHERLLAYLEQEGLATDHKIALVDMGWHGTMQRSLHRLIGGADGNYARIVGLYYGLWPNALQNISSSGLMESAFGSMFLKAEQQPELHESVDILEELHSAPHGTVLDYAIQPDGKWKAVTADSPVEMQQFEDITQHFQRGVVEELAGIFAGSSSTVLQLSDLTISNARGALGMISLSPTAAELEALSKLRHCATFDHLTISPIIPPTIPDTPEKIQQGFSSSGWRSGLLHHWLNIATPEQRKVIVDIAQSYLSQQNSRMKRIFQ